MSGVDSPDLWERQIGPTLSCREVADALGVSVDGVRDRTERGALLGLRTAAGVMRYPAFQFTASGHILAGPEHHDDSWRRRIRDPRASCSDVTSTQSIVESELSSARPGCRVNRHGQCTARPGSDP